MFDTDAVFQHTGSALWTSSDVERELEDRSISTDRLDPDGWTVMEALGLSSQSCLSSPLVGGWRWVGSWPANTFTFRESLWVKLCCSLSIISFFYSAAQFFVLFANLHLMQHIDLFISTFRKNRCLVVFKTCVCQIQYMIPNINQC